LQIPEIPGNWGLIDLDTPKEVYTKPSYFDSKQEMQLVFSDEFNTDGRTFYPGDDPYWEAVDLHYWQVNNAFLHSNFILMSTRPTIWSGMTPQPSQQKTVL